MRFSILRTVTRDDAWADTAAALQDAARFAEAVMGLPLPTEHVILVLDDDAVSGKSAGTNHDLLISFSPESEEAARGGDALGFQRGLVHEVAHYYWSGNQGWVNEGLANMVEHLYVVETGAPAWTLENPRKDCEVPDLEALAAIDPLPGHDAYSMQLLPGPTLVSGVA